MDAYKVSAQGSDKRGKTVSFSILVTERDSEVIPEFEKKLMLMIAAQKEGISLRSPIRVELEETK